jgi:O-antigen/teichoic acid export membrane protein
MKAAALSILLRYLAIAIQFAVVICVTRTLPIDIAGKYFTVFGIIAVAFTLSGIGTPDGCVKNMSEARARKDVPKLRAIALGAIPVSFLVNLGISGVIGGAAAKLAGLDADTYPIIALWWFGYAGTFFFAQFLVGAGRSVMATFFAYSSINLVYVVSLLPALIFMTQPDLSVVMLVAAVASNVAMVCAAFFSWRAGRKLFKQSAFVTWATRFAEARSAISAGLPMMLSRFMQASLPWIPVWVLGYFHSAEAAAIYAAASRLTAAVTSVVAALRFSMRGTIVEANAAKRFKEIAALNHTVSFVSAIPPFVGLIFLATLGSWAVPLVFGGDYAACVPVLIILMFGVFWEAFGGLSDEILKMTGRSRIVLWSLFAAMMCQCICGLMFAKYGPLYVAGGTVVAFTIQYAWQVIWLSRKTQIAILPFLSPYRGAGR